MGRSHPLHTVLLQTEVHGRIVYDTQSQTTKLRSKFDKDIDKGKKFAVEISTSHLLK